ncbi:MAG: ABC transporter substrate-binding protein, partial [Gammaproteobacteria bacterium]
LQSGNIDATEWVGPYNDLAFGLYKAAKYYYYPGFHEPGTALELLVNREALARLPADLQAIVLNAAKVVNADMLAEYTARNPGALEQLIEQHGAQLRQFPPDVLAQLRRVSAEVVAGVAEQDAPSKKVYDAYQDFLARVRAYTDLTELAYVRARDAS